MPFYGVVYAEASKLPRRVIISDDQKEFDGAFVGLANGEGAAQLTALKDGSLEGIKAALAERLGIDVETIPSGRCAVVDPKTGDVQSFILADPALDSFGAKSLIASDEAQENWKYDGGKFLARFVGGGPDGVVAEVKFAPPDQPPQADAQAARYVMDSYAKPGDEHPGLKDTEVDTSGTNKL